MQNNLFYCCKWHLRKSLLSLDFSIISLKLAHNTISKFGWLLSEHIPTNEYWKSIIYLLLSGLLIFTNPTHMLGKALKKQKTFYFWIWSTLHQTESLTFERGPSFGDYKTSKISSCKQISSKGILERSPGKVDHKIEWKRRSQLRVEYHKRGSHFDNKHNLLVWQSNFPWG